MAVQGSRVALCVCAHICAVHSQLSPGAFGWSDIETHVYMEVENTVCFMNCCVYVFLHIYIRRERGIKRGLGVHVC